MFFPSEEMERPSLFTVCVSLCSENDGSSDDRNCEGGRRRGGKREEEETRGRGGDLLKQEAGSSLSDDPCDLLAMEGADVCC